MVFLDIVQLTAKTVLPISDFIMYKLLFYLITVTLLTTGCVKLQPNTISLSIIVKKDSSMLVSPDEFKELPVGEPSIVSHCFLDKRDNFRKNLIIKDDKDTILGVQEIESGTVFKRRLPVNQKEREEDDIIMQQLDGHRIAYGECSLKITVEGLPKKPFYKIETNDGKFYEVVDSLEVDITLP